jgi:RimJ/RimL family protein N-acetyltransferase
MADEREISFRPLAHADLEQMHRWLNDDFVARWWPGWPSLEQVRAKYLPRIEGHDPTKCYMIALAGRPVGFIQSYQVIDDANLSPLIDQPERAAGIDIFFGDRRHAYRGLGPRVIRLFLRELVFDSASTDLCLIDPAQNNLAAIRAYEKVGFRYLATVNAPGELEPSRVMLLGREELRDE